MESYACETILPDKYTLFLSASELLDGKTKALDPRFTYYIADGRSAKSYREDSVLAPVGHFGSIEELDGWLKKFFRAVREKKYKWIIDFGNADGSYLEDSPRWENSGDYWRIRRTLYPNEIAQISQNLWPAKSIQQASCQTL